MAKTYTKEEIEQAELLDSHYPSMVAEPHRRGSGEGGKDEYISTRLKDADDWLKKNKIMPKFLSKDEIKKLRVDCMTNLAKVAGRSDVDIEDMVKYLGAGIDNTGEAELKEGVVASLAYDLEQQSNGLTHRREVAAENAKLYPDSDFREYDKRDEIEALSRPAHQ